MKLNKTLSVLVTLSIVAVAAVFTINHTTSAECELLKANIEALANDPNNPMNPVDDPEGGGGGCPSGGMANKKCNYWNVTYISTLIPPSITVSCTTGGSWKCESGACPHGN